MRPPAGKPTGAALAVVVVILAAQAQQDRQETAARDREADGV